MAQKAQINGSLSGESLRTLISNLTSGMVYQMVVTKDVPRKITYVSDSVRQFYGCSPEEAMKDANCIYGRVHPDDRSRLANEEEEALRTMSVFRTEARIISPSGKVRWSSFASTPRSLDDGSTCWDGIEFDITERKMAEEELQRNEVRYRSLIKNMSSAVAVYEVVDDGNDFIFHEFNDAAEKIENISTEDVIGRRVTEAFPAVREFGLLDIFKRVWQTGNPEHYADKLYKDNRIAGWRENYVYRLPSGEIVAIYDDVTERNNVQQELRLNESRLEALFHLSQMTGLTIAETANYALEEAVRLTNSKIGYVAFMNEDETVLSMHAWSAEAMKECAVKDKPILYPVANTGLWGEVVRQRKPIITNDYDAPNPLKKGMPEGHVKVKRHMNVPIFEAGKIVAVAGVGNKDEEYNETDIRQLILIMGGLWDISRRNRKEELIRKMNAELQEKVETMELFNRITMDREERILELKEEVERLRNKKGE